MEEEKEKEREKRELCLENYHNALDKFADSKSVPDEKALITFVKELDSYHVEDDELTQVKTCVLDVVEYYMKAEDISQARQIMSPIRMSMSGSDRGQRIGNEICFGYAEMLQKYGYTQDAYDEYLKLKDFENAAERADDLVDDVLRDYLENTQYDKGIQFLSSIAKKSDNPDSYKERQNEYYYLCAESCMDKGNYQKAMGYYVKSCGYKNAEERRNDAKFKYVLYRLGFIKDVGLFELLCSFIAIAVCFVDGILQLKTEYVSTNKKRTVFGFAAGYGIRLVLLGIPGI